ncbi:hypothetical protein GCM10007304_38640 [Rhodococcoides trifolii]|uniref:DUF2637 domain-containing protein n=1 Tax=Rhodococcoides trifolii TaxID=908250 RepID=A0A917G3K2_9NOCA|nr:DUF2637 domain-containing protein [Rhodococcus trifolii]GGG21055.1 hypothetical protein GCM10007304_38640 [Rhodococcus trifolii]
MTRVLRSVLVTAVCITTVIGVASFVLSFAALWDLATMAGIPRSLSWLWPVIVDGTILQATIAVIALASYPDQASGRRFFWGVLFVAASVSVAANALHAFISGAGTLPPVLSAAMATVAPVSLLAATHGLAVLVRVPGRQITAEPVAAEPVAAEPVTVEPVPEFIPAATQLPVPIDPPTPEEPADVLDVHAETLRLHALGLSAADVAQRLDVPKSIVERVTASEFRFEEEKFPVHAP